MKKLKGLFIVLFALTINNAFSQPGCEVRIKDAKPEVLVYMKKILGFTSTNGVKIACPGAYKTKSYSWRNIVGKDGPDDIFLANGVAITPKSPKGGYYEIFFSIEYSRWPDKSKWVLSNNWRLSMVKIDTYVPHNVPGENITAKDKLDFFYTLVKEDNKLSKFSRLKDYVEIDTIFALGKVDIISPTSKDVYVRIKGKKIYESNKGRFFTYMPKSFNDVKIHIEKIDNKWTAKFGYDDDHKKGAKFTILKPVKMKCLAIDGWDAVYKKMQITEGELKYMSKDLSDRLDKRVKAFAKMMNRELTGNEVQDIAKIKPYMLPKKADELAKAWYNLDVGGLKCGIEVKKYSFSGQVRREDVGGVKAFYNFVYYRPAAQTQEQIDLYTKCGVPADKLKRGLTKRESGDNLKVIFENKEWYIAEFPKLKYNYDGTKKGSTNNNKKKKKKSISKYF